MARRIDIELTSSHPDGSWTWRAAGALQPRGVLDGTLLHEGAKPGDVVKADAEFEIDGITIVAVVAPREKHRTEPQRIELLAPSRNVPGVTTQLAGRGDRRGPGRDDRHGPRPDRTPSARDGARRERPDGPRRDRADGPRRDREEQPRRERPEVAPDGSRAERPPRRERPRDGEGRRAEGGREPVAGAAARQGPRGDGAARGARRLTASSTHRNAVLGSLAPEERPVAEQVLRGGIPAVRTAIHLERERATAEGRPAPQAESLIALAESLLPRLKSAEWRDRADAADKAGDAITLRDLRSVVAGADLARDDESRQLAATLRERLEGRLVRLRDEWSTEIRHHLDEGRVVRALRLSGRPPEPGSRLEADLAARLTEGAGAAMTAETAPDRWAALLEAVVASPVRRSVKPTGLPPDPGEPLLTAARQQVGRVPALAPLLGISMPPPPGPARPPAPATRTPRRGGDSRRPRPPVTPDAASAAAAGTTGAPPETAPSEEAGPAGDGEPTSQPSAPEASAPEPEAPEDSAPEPEAPDSPATPDSPIAPEPAAELPDESAAPESSPAN